MNANTYKAGDLNKYNDSEFMIDVALKTNILNLKACNLSKIPDRISQVKKMQVCDLRYGFFKF